MTPKEYIDAVLAEKPSIKQVYWVACGGSMIDMIPASYLVNAQSKGIVSAFYTGREFCLMPPAKLGEETLVITCSHSGNTPENYDAATLAKSRGAAVIAMTNTAGSRIDSGEWPCWVYVWEDETPQSEKPAAFSLMLAAELIKALEGIDLYDALVEGIAKMDPILVAAKAKCDAELGERFAALCKEHEFLYILGSGPAFSQTYGFAICSLQEMQWQNCCYIHSGEYFHGPFECTEDGVFYFLQMGSGANRMMDERALAFLETHTDTLMVLDALEYGMDAIDESVRPYLDPILFYEMNVTLRAARGKVFDHDPDYRRYMGKVQY